MVHAMFQAPVATRVRALSFADLDDILAVIAEEEPDAGSSPVSLGFIARRLSRLVNLPMVGGPAVLSADGLAQGWASQKELKVRGSVPYSVSVNAVNAWFSYAQTDISFFLDDMSYPTIERTFFKVLVGVSDQTFESIMSNLRDRALEMRGQFIVPVGITLGDGISLGRKNFVDAWITRWRAANPRANMTLGSLTAPELTPVLPTVSPEVVKRNMELVTPDDLSFEQKMAAFDKPVPPAYIEGLKEAEASVSPPSPTDSSADTVVKPSRRRTPRRPKLDTSLGE